VVAPVGHPSPIQAINKRFRVAELGEIGLICPIFLRS
jgi:hypothetical protein